MIDLEDNFIQFRIKWKKNEDFVPATFKFPESFKREFGKNKKIKIYNDKNFLKKKNWIESGYRKRFWSYLNGIGFALFIFKSNWKFTNCHLKDLASFEIFPPFIKWMWFLVFTIF